MIEKSPMVVTVQLFVSIMLGPGLKEAFVRELDGEKELVASKQDYEREGKIHWKYREKASFDMRCHLLKKMLQKNLKTN